MGGLGLCLDVLSELNPGLLVGLVVGIQPALGGDGEAGIGQSLLHIHKIPGVDITGAGTALDGLADTAAVGCDLAGSSQRKIAVAFQQNGAFRQRLAQGFQVLLFIIK